ncbi:MAG TPA: hypothetical protein VNZ67_14770 [bacterium]|jgi:hypothetical protein|nr:hypothetical protein [bacterium]
MKSARAIEAQLRHRPLSTEDFMANASKKMDGVIKAAGAALEDGAARAASFADHDDFRRPLVAGLNAHPAFVKAVRAFHGQSGSVPAGAKGQTPRKVVPAGRVQAPRHDSPRGRRNKAG